MKLQRIALLGVVAGGLALSACSGKDESEAPTGNVANMAPIEVENTTAIVPTEAPPATVVDNVTAEPAPTAEPLTSDEQTQEDADATGMTARVSRDEGNESQPAE